MAEDSKKKTYVENLRKFLKQANVESAVFKNNELPKLEDLKDKSTFVPEESEYTKIYLEKLKTEKLLDEYELGQEYDQINEAKIIELAEKVSPFEINDEGEVYYMAGSEKKQLELKETTDIVVRSEIAESIPAVSFDIVQGGILERAKEAESIYKVIVLNGVFGGIYTARIAEIVKNYNYEDLTAKFSFEELLTFILQNSTAEVRMILAACNLNISNCKTKKELRIYSDLSDTESQELVDLKLDITQSREDTKRKVKKAKSPGEKLTLREAGEKEILDMIGDSKVGMMYRVLNMNVNCIPTRERMQISNLARILSFKIKERENIEGRDTFIREIERKLKKRAFREFIVNLKIEKMKALKNGEVVEVRYF